MNNDFEIYDLRVNFEKDALVYSKEPIFFSWKIRSNKQGKKQSTYQIVVYKDKGDGEKEIVWDSGAVHSQKSLNIVYQGEALDAEKKYYWCLKVSDENHNTVISDEQFFHTECDWRDSFWITAGETDKLPVFERKIILPKNKIIKNISLYASALGIYQIFANKKLVGKRSNADEEIFSPGWTDYNKLINYQCYDITDFAKDSYLKLEAFIGKGWFLGKIGRNSKYEELFSDGIKKLCFIAKVVVTFEDGTIETHNTNANENTWEYTFDSKIVENDFYDGEILDLTKSESQEAYKVMLPNFSLGQEAIKSRLNPSNKAKVVKERSNAINPVGGYCYLKNDVIEIPNLDLGQLNIKHVDVNKKFILDENEEIIIDFGQNTAGVFGVVAASVTDEKTKIVFETGEMINDGKLNKTCEGGGSDGPKFSLYQKNLSPPAGGECLSRDVLIFSGNTKVKYSPKYTFHGFRYLKISTTSRIELESIVLIPMSSVNYQTGKIKTNNSDVNQLFSNTIWGQKSNYLSIPTDCPQRSERVGWTGDAQVFFPTALYNYDSMSFLINYADIINNNSSAAKYSSIIPQAFVPKFANVYASGWSDVGIIITWILYKFSGNKYLLDRHYDNMHIYMKEIGELDKIDVKYDLNFFGDWLSFQGTSTKFVNLMYRAYCSEIMKNISKVLGKKENERVYEELYKKIKVFIQKEYVEEKNGKFNLLTASRDNIKESYHGYPVVDNAQTGLLWFLKLKMYETEGQKEQAVQLLFENIENENSKYREKFSPKSLSVGFLGINVLLPVLTDYGKINTAYDLLLNEEMPSWLYSVKNGATTIWERWNSYSIEDSFADARMNSFNHYSYGSVVEWMYKYMSGISFIEDGLLNRKIKLFPVIDKGNLYNGQKRICEVKCDYESLYGMIHVEWKAKDGYLKKCSISVPANYEAVLLLDTNNKANISCNSIEGADFTTLKSERGLLTAEYVLKSGTYEFSIEDSEINVVIPDQN